MNPPCQRSHLFQQMGRAERARLIPVTAQFVYNEYICNPHSVCQRKKTRPVPYLHSIWKMKRTRSKKTHWPRLKHCLTPLIQLKIQGIRQDPARTLEMLLWLLQNAHRLEKRLLLVWLEKQKASLLMKLELKRLEKPQ